MRCAQVRSSCFLFALLIHLRLSVSAFGAEWQWSAEIASITSTETNGHPRAFLWIPPDCKHVRAVIIGQNNMIEQGILESPILRKALSEIGMAAIWVTPAFDPHFRFDHDAGNQFQEMMTALADVSGYEEIKYAPVAPIGHSAMAMWPYAFAAWNPDRTLVAISIKGIYPQYRYKDGPPWEESAVKDAPILFINGEYEDAEGRGAKAAEFRDRVGTCPLTMIADVGAGHFDTHDEVIAILGRYLKKLASLRLPDDAPTDAPVKLKHIDPKTTGWLYDRWRAGTPPTAQPAPVAEYKGKKSDAFWVFDEEMARDIYAFTEKERGRRRQLVGYVQDDAVCPLNPKLHAGIRLRFSKEGDGSLIKVAPTFLDNVPEGTTWPGLPAGSDVPHADSADKLQIQKIVGPIERVGPDTWAIRYDRLGTDNLKRSASVWLLAVHPGDAQFKRAVQQSTADFPLRNNKGAEQKITFADLSNQKSDALNPVQLQATSSVMSQKVHFYVREGPAEVDDEGKLTFTAIPPRAKFPVKVQIVAWQWGRSVEPFVKTAEPVQQTIVIDR